MPPGPSNEKLSGPLVGATGAESGPLGRQDATPVEPIERSGSSPST